MKRVAGSTSAKKAGALFDLEETLGTNWLLKIGMALVVVGIALFLGYSIQRLGPWGKVTVGMGVSLAAIVGGWRIERRKGYETFGRVLLSGGWGLAYFTAYAMRYVEATRVLSSDEAGFFAMLLVAAGMVAQSLKYHSQCGCRLAISGFILTGNAGATGNGPGCLREIENSAILPRPG